jgi:hypothetical protein
VSSNIREARDQVDKLRANIVSIRSEVRELEYILYRTTSLLSRLGLPPEVAKVIQEIERMIMTLRILHSTMVYFEMGTPLGWILGAISGISGSIMAFDMSSH